MLFKSLKMSLLLSSLIVTQNICTLLGMQTGVQTRSKTKVQEAEREKLLKECQEAYELLKTTCTEKNQSIPLELNSTASDLQNKTLKELQSFFDTCINTSAKIGNISQEDIAQAQNTTTASNNAQATPVTNRNNSQGYFGRLSNWLWGTPVIQVPAENNQNNSAAQAPAPTQDSAPKNVAKNSNSVHNTRTNKNSNGFNPQAGLRGLLGQSNEANATTTPQNATPQQKEQEQERRAKQEQERRAKQEQERRAKQEQERLAKQEQERLAKQEQERRAQQEQERLAKQEQERLAKQEQERRAQQEQERLAKQEQERLAQQEQERRAKQEQERKAQQEQERLAKQEQERKAQQEQERLAKQEQERLAKQEQERKAQQEQERKAKQEQERLAKQEQERRAQQEQERKAQQEQERRAKQEQERLAQQEQERRAKQEQERLAQQEQERRAQQEQERLAKQEQERRAQQEQERRAKQEQERRAKQEQERRAQQEQERRAKQEQERRAKQEQERRAKQEQERLAQQEQERLAKQEEERRAKQEQERRAKQEQERLAQRAVKPSRSNNIRSCYNISCQANYLAFLNNSNQELQRIYGALANGRIASPFFTPLENTPEKKEARRLRCLEILILNTKSAIQDAATITNYRTETQQELNRLRTLLRENATAKSIVSPYVQGLAVAALNLVSSRIEKMGSLYCLKLTYIYKTILWAIDLLDNAAREGHILPQEIKTLISSKLATSLGACTAINFSEGSAIYKLNALYSETQLVKQHIEKKICMHLEAEQQ